MIKLKFHKPSTFELAKYILTKEEASFSYNDADQMLFFASAYAFSVGKSELDVAQIWDKKSFKGGADYQVI